MGAIDPGKFSRELVLETATRTADDVGGFTEIWAAVATVFARVEPLRAAAGVRGDREILSVTHRVTIRRRDDVSTGMRFRDGGRLLTVSTVHDPDESGRHLECLVREATL
ncbi:MAG: phage head closure protein [Rhizobiaceae bacterium]